MDLLTDIGPDDKCLLCDHPLLVHLRYSPSTHCAECDCPRFVARRLGPLRDWWRRPKREGNPTMTRISRITAVSTAVLTLGLLGAGTAWAGTSHDDDDDLDSSRLDVCLYGGGDGLLGLDLDDLLSDDDEDSRRAQCELGVLAAVTGSTADD